TDVLRSAAKFYKKKGDLDKDIELLKKALKFVPYNSFLYHQIRWFYEAKIKQIHNREESEAIANREKYAMEHLNEVIVEGRVPRNAHSDLTEHLEAQARCPTALSKELPDPERQRLQQHSCNLQEYHGKSEDTAAQHHLVDLSVSKPPTEKEEMKCQLQNLNENLPQNASNSWYLQGLNHELNGNLQQAAACYERELGHLLRNTPS
ncbi:PREDICTED: interferon-induced protein with tetratricopeptide repeats 3-like, partial [Galeopterus variegatus]|uniref:Interferon-induced protein with tetratricopeptide repeats 3-like n=1 Tax=Galeopterus variegatus TaxID=482537 RepID=A0ABM0Q3M2_GALVR